MSGEAAKERATTAYAQVPPKSKLLASELPNMETCSSIERHNDDIKTHVFCGSDVGNLTVKWPSERVTVKAICHKNVVDLKIPGLRKLRKPRATFQFLVHVPDSRFRYRSENILVHVPVHLLPMHGGKLLWIQRFSKFLQLPVATASTV